MSAATHESPAPPPRVVVVEDDAAVRASLARVLEEAGFEARQHGSAEEFLRDVDADMHGCVLLDVRMPGMSGVMLHDELVRCAPLLPVIFVTAHGDVPMAVDALRRGAFDFLEKPVRACRLIASVREALAWQATARAAEVERDEVRERFARLTEREREVVRLVAEGRTNKWIAAELKVTSQCIDARRANAMTKLGVTTVAHLVRLVVLAEGPAGAANRPETSQDDWSYLEEGPD